MQLTGMYILRDNCSGYVNKDYLYEKYKSLKL